MNDKTKYPFGQRITPMPNNAKPVDSPKAISPFSSNEMNDIVAKKYVHTILPISKNPNERMRPPSGLAQHVVHGTAANIVDADNILQLLPDMELAMQILISSILAPNNMMTCELNYVCDADDLGDLRAPMIDVVKDFFDNKYKINDILPTILEDVLFKKGAYPLAIVPESSVDEIINGRTSPSMESLVNTGTIDRQSNYLAPVGILGNASVAPITKTNYFNLGLESLDTTTANYRPEVTIGTMDLEIRVTDNVDLLKIPTVHSMILERTVSKAYAKREIGIENDRFNGKDTAASKIDAMLNYRRPHSFMPVVPVKTLDDLDRDTVGHPLILQLPPESIIPVHVPSEPKHHIGYFVAVDKYGNPIRANVTADFFADFAYNSQMLKDMSTQLLAQTRRNSEGRQDDVELMLNETMLMYTEVVERDIRSRLRNGLYGENVDVAKPTEFYRTMLYRKLAGMQTQLLFIPAQLMTYVAFDYNYWGVGSSLLEKTKILASIRAMMLFANTMAAIKNSTNHVELNLEFDPEDPDPRVTAERVMHEFARVRQSAYPIGASNPLDMVNYIQNAGISLTTSNHPNFPQTKLSVEDRQTNRAVIDSELDETLKKRHLASIGIAPESVDLSMNVDFAQSIVNSNILLAKRALIYQKKLCSFLSDFFYKFVTNSSILMEALDNVITANKDKLANQKLKDMDNYKIILYFMQNFRGTLPEPDMTKLENQKTAFELYSETLDMILPAFISSEMFDSSIFGELSSSVDNTVAILKAYYQRRWLQNNDVLPELFELTEHDNNGNPMMDVLKLQDTHMESIAKSLLEFMKKVLPKVKENNEALTKLTEDNDTELAAGGGDSGGGDDTGSGDDSGGDGGDDFSFGDEPNLDEEPTDDEGTDAEGESEEPAEKTEEEKPAEEDKAAEEKPAEEDKPEGEEDK